MNSSPKLHKQACTRGGAPGRQAATKGRAYRTVARTGAVTRDDSAAPSRALTPYPACPRPSQRLSAWAMGILANIFTWWNGATFGTWLFTKRKGSKVGEDHQGNVYY